MVAWDSQPFIDLGDTSIRDDPAEHVGGGRPWWRSTRYHVIVLVLAMLLLVAASGPAPAAPLQRVGHIPVGLDASLLVDGDTAYVLDYGHRHNELRAFRLDGSGPLWTTRVLEVASDSTIRVSGDVVLVSFGAEHTNDIHTEAFTAATGARLWRSTESVIGLTTDGDPLMQSRLTFPAGGKDTDAPTTTLRRVDIHTGHPQWTVPVTVDCDTELETDPGQGATDGLVEFCTGYPQLRLVDLASGAVTAHRSMQTSGDVPALPPAPPTVFMTGQLFVFGDIVVVLHVRASEPEVDAYDGADLSGLWSLPLEPWQTLVGCGDVLCLNSSFGDVVIDPSDGTQSRTDADDEIQTTLSGPTTRSGPIMLAPTGPGWAGAPYPVLDFPAGTTVEVPPASLGSVWVERAATAGPAATPIAPLSGVGAGSCYLIERYLVCSTDAQTVTIWRVPAGDV
jgi:hypothetical protein